MLLHILHLSVDCCLGGELISRLAYVDFAGFDEDWEETAAIFDVGLLCAMPLLLRTVIHLCTKTSKSLNFMGLPVVRIFSSSFFQKLLAMCSSLDSRMSLRTSLLSNSCTWDEASNAICASLSSEYNSKWAR